MIASELSARHSCSPATSPRSVRPQRPLVFFDADRRYRDVACVKTATTRLSHSSEVTVCDCVKSLSPPSATTTAAWTRPRGIS